MAAITITKKLGVDNVPLISVFNPQVLKFDFQRDALTGTYAVVVVNGIEFFATKISTSGTTDSYSIDLTDILKYTLGFPSNIWYNTSALTKAITITINGKNSAGSTIASNSENVNLCYGTSSFPDNSLDLVYITGSSEKKYHDGNVVLYFNNVAGNYTFSFFSSGGSILGTHQYYLVNGFNLLEIPPVYYPAAQMSLQHSLGNTTLYLTYITPPTFEPVYIRWINKDGGISEHVFRKLTEQNAITSSNEIQVYNESVKSTFEISRDITKTKTITTSFDTIAIDSEHFKLLTEIADSPQIYYYGKLVTVSNISDTYSFCKSSKFNISLKRKEYVASY